MARRSGSADLPLHGGRVPPWLAARMASLGAIVCQAIVHHYGRDEFLRRLSHPFWFQSFGAVMGMDWHSSGITSRSCVCKPCCLKFESANARILCVVPANAGTHNHRYLLEQKPLATVRKREAAAYGSPLSRGRLLPLARYDVESARVLVKQTRHTDSSGAVRPMASAIREAIDSVRCGEGVSENSRIRDLPAAAGSARIRIPYIAKRPFAGNGLGWRKFGFHQCEREVDDGADQGAPDAGRSVDCPCDRA